MKFNAFKFVPFFALMLTSGLYSSRQPNPVQANLTIGAVERIDYSESHSFIQTKNNKIYALGKVNNSRAMLSSIDTHTTPSDVTNKFSFLNGGTLSKIAVGSESNIFLTSTGTVFTSGDHNWGQMGNNEVRRTFGYEVPVNITSQFGDLASTNDKITDVFSSAHVPVVNAAISDNGRVWTWGGNTPFAFARGKTGTGVDPSVKEYIIKPEEITNLFTGLGSSSITKIAFTRSSGVAITDGKLVYTWGTNTEGVLGLGSSLLVTDFKETPEMIDLSNLLDSDETLKDVATYSSNGSSNSVLITTSKNRLIGWGANLSKIFHADAITVSEPTLVDTSTITFLEGENIQQVLFLTGVYLLTSAGRVIYKGDAPLRSLANIWTNEQRNTYRSAPYFIDATNEFPVMPEGDFIKVMYGISATFVALTNMGSVFTAYGNNFMAESLKFGTNASFLLSQSPGNKFKVFIGNSETPYANYAKDDKFRLPKQTAPDGFYHAGWSRDPNATTPFGNSFDTVANRINYEFTFTDSSHIRIYPVFLAGADPTISSSSSSSASSSSAVTTSSVSTSSSGSSTSVNTTSTTSVSTTSTTSIPSTSTPTSTPSVSIDTDNPDDTSSPLLPILVGTALVAGLGTFSWLFIGKGISIGGFTFVKLKAWFAAILKRAKKK